ncbi:hypothetical protein MHYP_G00252490 [Metynnis hypsauchen]
MSHWLQRNGLKLPSRKDRWETAVVKRQKEEKEEEEEVTPELDDSVFADLPSSMERTQERVKERLLKKTYSKKNKRVSVCDAEVDTGDLGSCPAPR